MYFVQSTLVHVRLPPVPLPTPLEYTCARLVSRGVHGKLGAIIITLRSRPTYPISLFSWNFKGKSDNAPLKLPRETLTKG